MSPKAKKNEIQKTGIRKMRFTLKIKITILVFFLLIFTIAITANFIIQYQNKILDDQMSETMSVYLNTFKQTVSSSIFERNDRFTLQQFLTSYQSIPSFWIRYWTILLVVPRSLAAFVWLPPVSFRAPRISARSWASTAVLSLPCSLLSPLLVRDWREGGR